MSKAQKVGNYIDSKRLSIENQRIVVKVGGVLHGSTPMSNRMKANSRPSPTYLRGPRDPRTWRPSLWDGHLRISYPLPIGASSSVIWSQLQAGWPLWVYTPGGRAEAAPASIISETAFVTNSEWSAEDLLFLSSRANGGDLSHTRSYPNSIHLITHLLFTNVFQKGAQFEMLPIVIGVEPAGSGWDCRFHSSLVIEPTHGCGLYKI